MRTADVALMEGIKLDHDFRGEELIGARHCQLDVMQRQLRRCHGHALYHDRGFDLKLTGFRAIREVVSRLLDNAARILETAELGAATALTILMRGGKLFEISTANDWALDSLLRERGADEAYRVRRNHAGLIVEGRSRTHSCEISQNVHPRRLLLA